MYQPVFRDGPLKEPDYRSSLNFANKLVLVYITYGKKIEFCYCSF